MNLLEHEAKALFTRYGIPVPPSRVITPRTTKAPLAPPLVIKSQVPVGDRQQKGGIASINQKGEFKAAAKKIWQQPIDGHLPAVLLVEKQIIDADEHYVSISYDTATRAPVLAINKKGGSGIAKAQLTPIDPLLGLPNFLIRTALSNAKLPPDRTLTKLIASLWQLFQQEHCVLAEINPLFAPTDGTYIAGDAKVILDDSVVRPGFRPYIELGGDIAVIASGGGASMINLDTLLRRGGQPANYVEYSGNPKGGVVADLTEKVLSQPNLKGCWVIGGTANFTDIHETLSGFVTGLRRVTPQPTYPIVIRRDGPRQAEAFAMLKEVAEREGYQFHLYGPEIPMSKSAEIVVQLAYGASKTKKKRTPRKRKR